MGQRGLEQARAAVESRLESLFAGGWQPAEDETSDDDRAAGVAPSRAPGGRWRIDPGRRAAAAMVAVVVFTAAVIGWRVLADRPRAQALPDSSAVRVSVPASPGPTGSMPVNSATASAGGTAPSAAPTSRAAIVVDVVGKVRRPGIVHLPSGARVDDAVRAAGGTLPHANLTTLNLARVCTDGEQIVVGQPGSAAAAPATSAPGAGSGTAAAGALVNLNTATTDQLDALPGVGPVMAQRILDWRTTHGAFASVDQLKQVSGIGDAKYADLSPLVTV